MKKAIIIILVILVVGVGAYFVLHKQANAPADNSGTNQPTETQTSNNQATPPAATSSGQTNTTKKPDYVPPASPTGGETPGAAVQVTEVDFDGTQFTPQAVNIKVNDYVFFKNKSTTDMWVASNPHPTHTDYPGFDSLKAIAPGGEYKFQFTKLGSWSYHDHLNPSIGGTVNVSQ